MPTNASPNDRDFDLLKKIVNNTAEIAGGGGSGSEVEVTNFPATQAVSVAALPLPSGASSEATLAALNTKTPTVGQKTMAASAPVVLASDQSALPVTGTFFQATQPVSAAALPLPLGAATETTLAAVSGKLGSLGQKTASGSAPVVLASDQTLSLPTGAATETTLAAINTKTPALGQALMVASVPVTLASNQPTLPVSLAANQSVNNAQIAGTAVSVGAGATDAGTQRVLLANEQVQDLYITGQSAQTATVNNIIPATAGASATDCLGYRSFSVHIVTTGTVSGGTVTFEGSNDNINFVNFDVNGINDNGSVLNSVISGNITMSSGNPHVYAGSLPFRYLRLRIVSAITGGGSIQAFSIIRQVSFYGIRQAVAAQGTTAVSISSGSISSISTSVTPGTAAANLGKAEDAVAASGDTGVAVWGVRRDAAVVSASASGDCQEMAVNKWGGMLNAPFGSTAKTFRGVANVAAALTATDIAILPGNATNTVYVTKVSITGIQTTAGMVDVLLVKRSAANTAGTSAAITAVPMDASDAAAVSAPLSYTANPTPGAAVGSVDRAYIAAAPLATGTIPSIFTFDFGRYGKPIILSGIAQGLAVNLNGVTVAGGTFTIVYEWMELP